MPKRDGTAKKVARIRGSTIDELIDFSESLNGQHVASVERRSKQRTYMST